MPLNLMYWSWSNMLRRCSGLPCTSTLSRTSSRTRAVTHNILVRIRIRGSMPLTKGSGSCYFRDWPSRCQQGTNFFRFFCLFLYEGTFTSFFKDKKVKKKSQNSRNQCFAYYICLMIEGSGSRTAKNIRIRQTRIRNTVYERIWMRFFSFEPWPDVPEEVPDKKLDEEVAKNMLFFR